MRCNALTVTLMISVWGLMFGLSIPSAAKDAGNAAVRRAIILAYHNENVAADHRDVAAGLVDFSPRWYAHTPKGAWITYPLMKQTLQATFAYQKSVTHHDKIISLAVTGDKAQARISGDDTQVLLDPQTQQTLAIETKVEGIDYWQRMNGHWLHSWSKIFSMQVTRNGKVVDKEP